MPDRILVAGMPRSGSTWLFNAIRLTFLSSGSDLYSEWIENYNPEHTRKTHLVKIHSPSQDHLPNRMVLTTFRPFWECMNSLVRMGWISADLTSLRDRLLRQFQLYKYWNDRSSYEVDYFEARTNPASTITKLAALVEINISDEISSQIAVQLETLASPNGDPSNLRLYDTTTLLHPAHRALQQEKSLSFISRAVSQQLEEEFEYIDFVPPKDIVWAVG